jgi:CheY-like chemotaxis protein
MPSDFSSPYAVPPSAAAYPAAAPSYPAAPAARPDYAAHPGAASHPGAAPAGRDCIIVADDSELSLSIMRRVLSPHFDLIEAHNGAEIVQVLHNPPRPISAVLCDLMMPVMDGFQVIDFMQKNGLLNVIPVITSTALSDAQSKIQCYEAGAFDVLDKPVDAKFLPFKIRWDIDHFRNLRNLSANPLAQARLEQMDALFSAIPAAIYVEDPATNAIRHCNAIFLQIPGIPENPDGLSIDSFPLAPEMLAAVRSAREALLVHNISKPVLFNGSVPGTIYSVLYTTFLNPVSSVTQLLGFITNATHEVQPPAAPSGRYL